MTPSQKLANNSIEYKDIREKQKERSKIISEEGPNSPKRSKNKDTR